MPDAYPLASTSLASRTTGASGSSLLPPARSRATVTDPRECRAGTEARLREVTISLYGQNPGSLSVVRGTTMS
jgi:hypothetical protein